jgi:DNA-binding NarL/FixJ family response regulator
MPEVEDGTPQIGHAPAPVRVVIADDQHLVRAGLRIMLDAQADVRVVGEAADGAKAVALCREARPDVVLMDVRMPVLDGVEATRRLVSSPDNATRVLVLTTFDLDEHVYDALRAGASGFLLKDASPESLVAAVRSLARGESAFAPTVLERLLTTYLRQPRAEDTESVRTLTERETEVLELVGRGCTNADIARRLYISETTVKTHIARLFTKLGVRDRAQAVVMAYETGLVVPGKRPPSEDR